MLTQLTTYSKQTATEQQQGSWLWCWRGRRWRRDAIEQRQAVTQRRAPKSVAVRVLNPPNDDGPFGQTGNLDTVQARRAVIGSQVPVTGNERTGKNPSLSIRRALNG